MSAYKSICSYFEDFAKFYFLKKYSIATSVYSNQIVLTETLGRFLSGSFFSFYEALLIYKNTMQNKVCRKGHKKTTTKFQKLEMSKNMTANKEHFLKA